MKLTRKPLLVLAVLTTLIASLLLGGCGKSITPTDSALAYFDLFQKGEINKDKLPLNEKEANDALKKTKDLSVADLKKNMEPLGITDIPTDISDDLYKKATEIAKKITPKAEEVSKDGDKAVVKLTSKPINSKAYENIIQEGFTKLTPEQQADPKAILKVFQDYFGYIVKNPVYVDKDVSIQITMKKVDNKWIIASDEEAAKLEDLTITD